MEKDIRQGYLTVYLSLMLTLILSFLLALITGAKVNAARMKAELTAQTAMESALSEYSRQLFERYDLLFVDLSYGSGAGSEENLENHLRDCVEKNFSVGGGLAWNKKTFMTPALENVSVLGTRSAVDNNSAALREQVTAYMEADQLEAALGGALQLIDRWQGLGIDTDAWQREKESVDSGAGSAFDASRDRFEEKKREARERLKEGEDTSAELEAINEEEENAENDGNVTFIRSLTDMRNDVLLSSVLADAGSASSATVDTGSLLSHRSMHTGTSLAASNTHHYGEADQIVFDEYILEKCGNYRNLTVGGESLDYEIEYILNGNGSDRDNLSDTVMKLLLVRESLNAAYAFKAPGLRAEAEAIAAAACAALLVPECTDALANVILLAMSMVESERDVKTLLAGGKIPLMKDSSTWRTTVTNLKGSISAETGGTGLKYEDYLRAFLFLENAEQKNERLMDVMEMNIRQTKGNSGFCMDWCIDSFSADFEVQSGSYYHAVIAKEISYN